MDLRRVIKTGTDKFGTDLLSNGEFVEQPNGTHDSPDFFKNIIW